MNPSNNILTWVIFPLLFAAIFLALNGFDYGYGNNALYLPVVQNMMGEGNLENDFTVSNHKYYHINFMRVYAFLGHYFELHTIAILGYLLVALLFYFSIFLVTRELFEDRRLFFLSIVLLLLLDSQGIEFNTFWQNEELEAQYVAWPFVLLCFAFSIKKSHLLSGLFGGLALFFHFQMGVIIFGALVLTILVIERSKSIRHIAKLSSVYLLFFIPIMWELYPTIFTEGVVVKNFTVDYLMWRIPIHMRLYPELFAQFSLFVVAGALWCFLYKKLCIPEPEAFYKHKFVIVFSMILFILFVTHYIDVYYLKYGFIAKIQFVRISPIIHLFAIIYISALLLCLAKMNKKLMGLFSIILCFVILPTWLGQHRIDQQFLSIGCVMAMAILFFKRSFITITKPTAIILLPAFVSLIVGTVFDISNGSLQFRRPYFQILPKESTDPWINIGTWISKHTKKDGMFITPPHRSGFAFYSQRSFIAEFKGNPHIERQAYKWLQRLGDLSATENILGKQIKGSPRAFLAEQYRNLTPDHVAKIAQKYDADYFVTDSNFPYPYKTIGSNQEFTVYHIIDK